MTAKLLTTIFVRGLHIDAKCGEGGVVNLVVRAHQQHKGIWRRFRQHVANALFRAGDACNTSYDHSAVRVVLRNVPSTSGDDGLPYGAYSDVRKVWPIHTSNGDAHYMALLVHEGVKRHYDGKPAFDEISLGRGQKGTDDTHKLSPCKTAILAMPQGSGKGLIAPQVAELLGCTKVVDEWYYGQPLTPGALHLTNEMGVQGGNHD